VRARKGRFHAVAELHYGAWSNVSTMTWLQKGIEFRKRMVAAGYNVTRGDTWAINELPSTVRYDAAVRANVRQLVQGLYTGPVGSPPRAGIVFVIGNGSADDEPQRVQGLPQGWLADGAFWSTMDKYVLHWARRPTSRRPTPASRARTSPPSPSGSTTTSSTSRGWRGSARRAPPPRAPSSTRLLPADDGLLAELALRWTTIRSPR